MRDLFCERFNAGLSRRDTTCGPDASELNPTERDPLARSCAKTSSTNDLSVILGLAGYVEPSHLGLTMRIERQGASPTEPRTTALPSVSVERRGNEVETGLDLSSQCDALMTDSRLTDGAQPVYDR